MYNMKLFLILFFAIDHELELNREPEFEFSIDYQLYECVCMRKYHCFCIANVLI
jgi:hypothetical protein